jgi:hypothetical protein
MGNRERRKSQRNDSTNLIDFVVLGENGQALSRRMGRTLNVSTRGFLLESLIPVEVGQQVRINVALEEEVLEIQGKVAHVSPSDENHFRIGIELLGMGEKEKEVLTQYIELLKSNQGT